MTNLPKTPKWAALTEHATEQKNTTLAARFKADDQRFEKFQLNAAGWFLDFSKNHISDETVVKLAELAEAQNVSAKFNAMFEGDVVNPTEGRAALHSALRYQGSDAIKVDGDDVMPGIRSVLDRMAAFANRVRDGEWLGFSGKRITDVVNVGIGGSDLGPLMATEALKPFTHEALNLHFVSNVDGSHMVSTLKKVNPETTLFIVASKTFTTIETLTNATTAKDWFLESKAGEQDVAKHFVALSTNAEKVAAFGIDTNNMFEFWDWVGGRYSLWSAIGMPLMLAIGPDGFTRFLEGAAAMDEHAKNAPVRENMPVTLALLTVWYSNFFGATSHLIAPYDQYLHRFPAYLQQLTMESNGKSVHVDGSSVSVSTGPVVWGEPGTNGQHAYFQLLHQGTHLIPADFILAAESCNPCGNHHELLIANCLAQTEALMQGKSTEDVVEEMRSAGVPNDKIESLKTHRTFAGNRPTNTLLTQRLDAYTLGSLIALYEHKVFAEAAIWDINPFDQWGVELGKQLATTIYNDMQDAVKDGKSVTSHDSSTNGLINRINASRSRLA